MTETIKIKGGSYRWRNDGDGYFTVLDVPLISEWAKGSHDAPYAGTKEILEEFVATHQRRYKEGHFCATSYKRHNPDIPIDHPDFLGFVLPNRVGKYILESGEKWTAFGDVKLTAAAFEEAKAGKIPYVSAEVPWAKRRIRGLSFQDTLPPEYEYALFTIGEEAKDQTGKFEVAKESLARFMEDAKEPHKEPHKESDEDDAKMGKYVDAYLEKHLGEHVAKHMGKMMGVLDTSKGKPDAMPVEPTTTKEGAKMIEPEIAAKMTALANDNAEIKAKFAAMESAEKAKKLVAKAESALSHKIVSTTLLEQIGLFAAEWVPAKDGEARFDKYIEALKPSLRDKPPSSMAEFVAGAQPAADPGDPSVAKFAAEGPDVMSEVGKFAGQWRSLKAKLGDKMQCTEENFIKNELMLWKARKNGSLAGERR